MKAHCPTCHSRVPCRLPVASRAACRGLVACQKPVPRLTPSLHHPPPPCPLQPRHPPAARRTNVKNEELSLTDAAIPMRKRNSTD